MKDPAFHLFLFAIVAIAIVTSSAFYADAEDAPAFRSIARRLFWFVGGCALLAALILLAEHTVAAVH